MAGRRTTPRKAGPTRTKTVNGIRNSDWFVTVFGDGFDPAVDPTDPNIVYSQWQYGGLVRFDRRTGERVDIKPQEDKAGPPLRWNWDSPILISPHAATRLYYGSQILFRSDDRGDTWRAVSPDLSRNLDRNTLKVMGRVWGVDTVAKNDSTSFYGSIITIAESPLVEGLLYVGTDDGLMQISEDGGQNWRKVENFPSLDVPEYALVNDIEASRHDPNTVYVVLYNFQRGDFKPYVVKSTDRGRTWSSIVGDLPERGSTYTIVQDHVKPDLLFVGTEFGLFLHAGRRHQVDSAQERPADDCRARSGDPASRERPGGRHVWPRLLHSRRLLAAARAEHRTDRKACPSLPDQEGAVVHPERSAG